MVTMTLLPQSRPLTFAAPTDVRLARGPSYRVSGTSTTHP